MGKKNKPIKLTLINGKKLEIIKPKDKYIFFFNVYYTIEECGNIVTDKKWILHPGTIYHN